ncbi:MAG: aldehyde dehydrogenase family protein, partial [Sneathiella sp.]|nr:aldehyde dehydrogenase family protein [Sneathiella sp.]
MPESLKTISPVDGSLHVERPYTSPENVEKMLRQPKEAQDAWQKRPVAERAAILTKCIDQFVAKKDL